MEQVIHLLQLAPAILIELAIARQDMQLFEEFDGLAGFDFGVDVALQAWYSAYC
jgi:hypothetical protein